MLPGATLPQLAEYAKDEKEEALGEEEESLGIIERQAGWRKALPFHHRKGLMGERAKRSNSHRVSLSLYMNL